MKEKALSLKEKWNEKMILIEKKTGFKGEYVLGVLIICMICIYFEIFDTLITNLVGTLYPLFWTIKSIESRSDEIKKWLTYWVVFGVFIFVDMFKNIIVKFIPLYLLLKVGFLIWLYFPGSEGCNFVYHIIVKRIFSSVEGNFQQYVGNKNDNVNESGRRRRIVTNSRKYHKNMPENKNPMLIS